MWIKLAIYRFCHLQTSQAVSLTRASHVSAFTQRPQSQGLSQAGRCWGGSGLAEVSLAPALPRPSFLIPPEATGESLLSSHKWGFSKVLLLSTL